MKKFLFVAILGGSLIACNDTTTTVSPEDSARIADSIANANKPLDTATTVTPPMDTTTMMSGDTSTMMSADSTPK